VLTITPGALAGAAGSVATAAEPLIMLAQLARRLQAESEPPQPSSCGRCSSRSLVIVSLRRPVWSCRPRPPSGEGLARFPAVLGNGVGGVVAAVGRPGTLTRPTACSPREARHPSSGGSTCWGHHHVNPVGRSRSTSSGHKPRDAPVTNQWTSSVPLLQPAQSSVVAPFSVTAGWVVGGAVSEVRGSGDAARPRVRSG
jgi:hypothetical protein